MGEKEEGGVKKKSQIMGDVIYGENPTNYYMQWNLQVAQWNIMRKKTTNHIFFKKVNFLHLRKIIEKGNDCWIFLSEFSIS